MCRPSWSALQMTLADLGKLQPGQLIRLPASFAKPVTLESDGIVLHRARLGQQSPGASVSVSCSRMTMKE